ncbi:MAG: leucine-rich repeat domain-containing protein [Clostridiales bacterium]|nr:leucine-rich repeat domain-containing protein [Clostridiales bacterium]
MALSYVPCISVWAGDSGECGDDAVWSLSDDGVLTITGTGEIWDGGWDDYSITSVSIGEGITVIGEDTFWDCQYIKSVSFPTTLTEIGYWAFEDCISLESVDLSVAEGLTAIRYNAFRDCTSLKSVTLPSSVESLEGAFVGCSALAEIIMEGGENYFVEDNVIYERYNYTDDEGVETSAVNIVLYPLGKTDTEYVIPDSVRGINEDTFYGNTHLVTVTVPSSVEYIDGWAFQYCVNLQTVNLSEGLTHIGDSAFFACESLKSITIPSTVETIDLYAFYGCTSLSEVNLSEGLEYLGYAVFYGCESLTSIYIPSTVTSIGEYAFSGCSSLAEITVGSENQNYSTVDGVLMDSDQTEIIFYPSGLTATTFEIPASVTYIDYGAFASNAYLAEITVAEGNEAYCGIDGVLLDIDCTEILCYPAAKTSTSYSVPDGVTGINEYVFAYNTYLTSVTVPSSVSYIDGWAFYYCTNLETITLSEGLNHIGDSAFWGCEKLTSITIPSTVSSVDLHAFAYCTALEEVTLSEGNLSYLGEGVFINCTSLKEIYIPNGVYGLYNELFYGCSSLTTVYLPSSINWIDDDVFYGCDNLAYISYDGTEDNWSSLSIGNGNDALNNVTFTYSTFDWSIEDGVLYITGSGSMPDYSEDDDNRAPWYYSYDQINSIVIEDGVTSIGKLAFDNSGTVETITINGSIRSIGNAAFRGSGITSITLPDSLKSIGDYTFQYCNNLTTINIPENVNSISRRAFVSCANLESITADENSNYFCSDNGILYSKDMTSIYATGSANPNITNLVIPDSVNYIYDNAFTDCLAIETLTISERDYIYIGDWAFMGCTNLVSADIYGSAPRITSYTFQGCTSLESVTIPTSVSRIEEYAFGDCSSLKTVNYDGSEDDWNNINIYEGNEYLTNAYETGDISYTIENGVLTVSGTGKMANYDGDSNRAPWADSYDDITSIVIESGITRIGSYAFAGSSSVESVSIPETVTSIGDIAFQCVGASSITLPDSLTSIGGYAFQSSHNLTSIVIPENVTYIGGGVFDNCTGLETITIADGNTSFCSDENGIVYTADMTEVVACGCANTKVADLVIPNTVKYVRNSVFGYNDNIQTVTVAEGASDLVIGDWTFSNCNNLVSADLTGVTEISSGAFYNSPSLATVTVSTSLSYVGESAFECCDSLKTVNYDGSEDDWNNINIEGGNDALVNAYYTADISYTIENGVLTISGTGRMPSYDSWEDTPWHEDKDSITEVIIESGITTVGSHSFETFDQITSVSLPEGLTSIGGWAFCGCTNLQGITFPETLTTISDCAFEDCKNITELYIPANVTSMAHRAFGGTGIATITVSDDNTNYYCENNFALYNGNSLYFCAPASEATSLEILDTVIELWASAVRGCTNLESVTIPEGVDFISSWAFEGCSNLTTITIPSSVNYVYDGAFNECYSLSNVIYNGDNWDGITIEDNNSCLTEAYEYTNNVSDVVYTLEDGVLTISLADGTGGSGWMPNNINYTASWYAENDIDSITSVVISDGITRIGSYAFQFFENLESVTIPTSVTTVKEYAFDGCDSLTTVNYDGSEADWENISIDEGNDCLHNAYDNTITAEISWSVENGVLTVTGTGKMPNYDYEGAPWYDQRDNVTSIYVDHGITSIGNCAFYNFYNVTDVTLPSTLRNIYDGGFEGCTSLPSINFPEIVYIASWAFNGCSSLTSMLIPTATTSIGSCAFNGCTSLQAFEVSDGNPSYVSVDGVLFTSDMGTLHSYPAGKEAQDYTVPDSVGYIMNSAFYASNVQNVTLPDGLWCVENGAFDESTIESVNIPASLNTVADNNSLSSILHNCFCLESITVAEDNELFSSEDGIAFNFNKDKTQLVLYPRAKSDLTEYTVPDSVTSIGSYAVCNPYLTTINLTENVTEIKDGAFSGCSSLTDFTIPSGVTIIEDCTFQGCESLTSFTIPENVTSIGVYAFNQCYGLESVSIPDSVTAIYGSSFPGCTSLKEITIPDSVTYLGDCAFEGCAALETAYISSNVTEILERTFNGCTSLTTVTLPSGLTSVGGQAFCECYSLTTVIYDGENWDNISFGGDNDYLISAYENSYTADITWNIDENGVLTISGTGMMADYADESDVEWYDRREEVTAIVIEDGITKIGARAFEYMTNATSLSIPDSVTKTGEYAFQGCESLTSISISANLTSLGSYAFLGCNSVSSLTVDENNPSYCSVDNILYNKDMTGLIYCPASNPITSLDIPESVTDIWVFALYGCTNLTDVTMHEGLNIIYNWSFQGCTNLRSVTLPSSLETVADGAFDSCPSLLNVYYSGSEDDWNNIYIEDNNSALINAYNYTIGYAENGATDLGWSITDGGVLTISGNGWMPDYAPAWGWEPADEYRPECYE